MKKIAKIPCNIITGFLGAGKTTTILHLLKNKPADEKWAVLVNEFGEVGIDGAILSGASDGVAIREVPGGCMCCVSGVPMQIGLTQLIRKARPDRLLIEPTGLGHPNEILTILQGENYSDILDVRAVVTLVDPRKLDDNRYREHKIYSDQLNVADVLVANKIDVCSESELANFDALLAQMKNRYADRISQGALDIAWLDVEHDYREANLVEVHHHHEHNQAKSIDALQLSAGQEILKIENSGQGFNSCGWIFSPEKTFDYSKLFNWFCGLKVTRAKAVLICDGADTDKEIGVFAFNSEEGVLSVMEMDDCFDQRLEIIHLEMLDWDGIESDWLQCLR
jgi:G3E family GTPase